MSESVPDARFGWRRFECRLVNVTSGMKGCRRGDAVVLLRDWGGARNGDDAVLVCNARGEPIGHLPAKCAGVIGEALDQGELFQGKLQNIGEENGRIVAYAGFSRAEDAEDVRDITKMLRRSGHAWAKFRTNERSTPAPSAAIAPTRASGSGCVSTLAWAGFFVLVFMVCLGLLVYWLSKP